MGVRWAAALTTVVTVLLACASPAHAEKTKVTITGDEYSVLGLGCSLREAVQTVNTDASFGGCARKGSGPDEIVLTGGLTYTRSRAGIEDLNATGDLDITGRTKIRVKGQGKATIDGNDLDRVIEIRPGARLDASRLIIRNGSLTSAQPLVVGAGILSQGKLGLKASLIEENEIPTNSGCPCGGGVGIVDGKAKLVKTTIRRNSVAVNLAGGLAFLGGDLTVQKSSISDNVANRGAGVYLGGSAEDSATFESSTISGNEALLDDSSDGGGMWIGGFGGAMLKATNLTISGNRANRNGGGIYQSMGSLKLNAATITDNLADSDVNGTGDGGGIYANNGVALRNSIVAGNLNLDETTADCGFQVPLFPHSLVGKETGCFSGGSPKATNKPKLRSLADNGGPTRTHALKPESPAVDKAHAGSAPHRDQRGVKRDAKPDIGAFER